MPILSRDRHVVAFDMPGFGLTGPVAGDHVYDIEVQARFALQVGGNEQGTKEGKKRETGREIIDAKRV